MGERVSNSPGRTAEMEINLFKLSRFYPGECRRCKRHLSKIGITVSTLEKKLKVAEVGVVSQVNGMMF
jgi:hypothetical protein